MFWAFKLSFVVDILAFFYLATFWAILGDFCSKHLVTLFISKLDLFWTTPCSFVAKVFYYKNLFESFPTILNKSQVAKSRMTEILMP
jgi:hypothetical protein